jgi:DNA-binding IclR family transcriptional regulator
MLTAAEIAWRLGIPKYTALRLLSTLAAAGFLRRVRDGEAFSLHAECLLLGQAFLSGSALARKARPVLQAFADRFNVHTLLCLPEQRGMLILLYLHSKTLKPLRLGSGHLVSLGGTAFGHAWLWKQEVAVQGKWLAQLRGQGQGGGSSQIAQVYQSFRDLEETGVCFSAGETPKSLSTMAAPLSLGDGSCGAIGCLQPAEQRRPAQTQLDRSMALREAAERIDDVLQRR